MPREIKRNAKSRAAAAEQKRLRRAQMTDEELKKIRAAEAERARKKRAGMTEEAIEKQRARDAATKRRKRLSLKSEEELKELRAREAAKRREKRLRIKSSEEELQKLRAREADLRRLKRANMTEEQREKLNAQAAESLRKRKLQMTEEERKKINAQKTEYNRKRKAQMTEEERKIFRAKKSERWKLQENGKTVENIRHMISLAGELANRQPERYKIPGTVMKNSLGDILNLHIEVAKMRKNLKHTVADAVKNALYLHQIQKQTRAEGYRSLTFVEIEGSPKIKRTIKQEVASAKEIEADPLLAQPVTQKVKEHDVSNANTNENDETFNVCNYIPPGVATDVNSDVANNCIKVACSICSKKFETSLGLTIHQKEHTDGSGEFKCSLCSQIFNTYNLMTAHYLDFHSFEFNPNEMNNEYEVEEVDEELERHNHEFEFSFLRKCLICSQTFDMERPGLSTYRNHIIHDHSENYELLKSFTYSCARCEKPHAVLRSLECHWKTFCYEKWKRETEENNGGIVCERCGMRFSNFKSLTSHITISHAEKEKEMCELCGKGFASLKNHMKDVHEGDKKFTCEHCGKAFKSRQNLIKHMRIVHLKEKRFACKLCHRRFENNAKLDYHVNTHTGEKPFKCKYCERGFAKNHDLKNHEGKHEAGTYKPRNVNENSSRNKRGGNYDYGLSGKTFHNPNDPTNSQRSPDDGGVKRFGCNLCGQTFRHKNNYYRHKVQKHKDNANAQIVKLTSEEELQNFPSTNFPSANFSSANVPSANFPSAKFPSANLPSAKFPSANYPSSNIPSANFPSANFPSANFPSANFPSTLQTTNFPAPFYNHYLSTLYHPLETGNSNISSVSLESQHSLERDDYSPEMDYDNEVHVGDIPLPHQYDVGQLENVWHGGNHLSLPKSNNAGNSTSTFQMPNAVFDSSTTSDLSQSFPHSSSYVDFSRANVPSGLSTLSDGGGSDTEMEKSENVPKGVTVSVIEQNPTVLKEDPEKDSFVADVDIKDVVKIKVEAPDPDDDDDYEPPSKVAKKTRSKIRKAGKVESRKKPRVRKKAIKSSASGKRKSNGSFDCLYCDKKSLSGRNIVIHCSKEHPGQKPLKCRICSWMSNTIDTFYNHKTKKHNVRKPKPPRDPDAKKEVICALCGKDFHTKQDLYQHNSNMHRDDVNVECDICHKIIRGKGNLKLHKQRHLGIKPHLCEECGLGFVTQVELKNHVRVAHRGELKRPQTSKSHPFPCLLCTRRFAKEIALQKHMDLHDPERKYPCDVCGLRFRTYDIRFAHIKVKHKKIKYVRKPRKPPPPDVFVMIP